MSLVGWLAYWRNQNHGSVFLFVFHSESRNKPWCCLVGGFGWSVVFGWSVGMVGRSWLIGRFNWLDCWRTKYGLLIQKENKKKNMSWLVGMLVIKIMKLVFPFLSRKQTKKYGIGRLVDCFLLVGVSDGWGVEE